ncbi:PREDICTED: putative fasciclin-like arabinogalactan protein 20 [Nelumbo nucifera]|uniref:FAS1 domain-containing protein n=2 Tax=Nelumbo nucifera TaxID=4432 RepID=A0A822ZNI5_NELNU|nr:PREDICTED: putative fasciclin-like arabinogalactan protein 20 [Nelumbo nucifera]DAD45065.1 TPA_asm: hypothetical protein HUJ06_003295 [Nelumbo nucifera]
MASSLHLLSILFLLFLSSFCVSPILGTAVTAAAHRVGGGIIPIEKIKNALSKANFFTMSLTLDMALNTMIPSEFFNSNHKTITIFCPSDRAFMSPGFKYAGPPLTLLRYHVALGKLDREALDSSKLHWSKVETLLTGHPLVVTSVNGRASINGVKITHWNLYNDGHAIVHGVEDFFDPAFQTIWFPQYDGGVPINNDEFVTRGSTNVVDFLLKLIE